MAQSLYPQLGDADWGQLLALGAVHRHCAPSLRAFGSYRAPGTILEAFLGMMATHAATAAQLPSDGAVIGAMSTDTAVTAATLATNPLTTVNERTVLNSIANRLAGGITDFSDPFAEVYDQCEAACAQLYGAVWSAPAAFELRSSHGHPRSLSDPYAVDAKTRRPADGGGVILQASLTLLGPEAFAVIPRVLLHELICHAGANDGDPPDPLSAFAEGFMDWASMHFLNSWAPTICPEYASAAIMHADDSALSFKSNFPTKAARESGTNAALDLVHQRGQAAEIAMLAVDINAASFPRRPKDEFVTRVLEGLLDANNSPVRDVLDGRQSVDWLLAQL